ncbi:hypothetical protein FOL47_009795 [Perkinsus chesapeaki]|uniref:Uncharacterized protein n=1 Tax=Perkinsus chesapeaki TaxID=330153 RepID=A0A7J6L6D1_PERCH|nr:hypothetical protein FOL47_009795 [Perkinsus chesapeaki]
MDNKLGYLVALIADEGFIMSVLAVGSCSLGELATGLRELKGRVPVDNNGDPREPYFTVYLDRGCCGREGEAVKRLFIKNTGCTVNLRVRLDCLHAQMRLTRSVSSTNHCRFGLFCRRIARAFFCSSKEDEEKARAEHIQKGGDGHLSHEQKRKRVRRFIPQPELLESRLAKVVQHFYRLDIDSESHHPASSTSDMLQQKLSEPLLGASFWPTYRSLLGHVKAGCLSDFNAEEVCTLDASGSFRWCRGTNRSENRHGVWRRDLSGVSILSPTMMDARLLWRGVFANRRLQNKLDPDVQTLPIPLAPKEAGSQLRGRVKLSDNPVTFGSEYLKATNEKPCQTTFCEWLREGNTGEDEATEGKEHCQGEYEDEGSDDGSSVSSDTAESASDIGERLRSLMNSGTTKGKILKMTGPRAAPHPVPLSKWTPLVKGIIGELVAEVGHQKPDEIYKRYQKRAFSELHDALEGKSDKPPLPLHDVTPQDIRVYARELCRLRSHVPITVNAMQQEVMLEREFRVQDSQQDIVRAEIKSAVVNLVGNNPPDRPAPVTGDDIVNDWKGQKARKDKVKDKPEPPPERDALSERCQQKENDSQNGNIGRGGIMSMVCKFCKKPKAKGYNDHDYSDGSRYGICPMQPQKDMPDPAVVAYARGSAKELLVEGINVKKGTRHCRLCGIPLSAVIRDKEGNFLPGHERFSDEELVFHD